MAVTDKQLGRLDEYIDNLLRKIYKDNKLPESSDVLENPKFISALRSHTSTVSEEAKSKSRELAKSNRDYSSLDFEVLKFVKDNYLNSEELTNLRSLVEVSFNDQARSLGIDPDDRSGKFTEVIKRLKEEVFDNNDTTTLENLKSKYSVLIDIQKDVKSIKTSDVDKSKNDSESLNFDDNKVNKINDDMSEIYLFNFFRNVLNIIGNKISSISVLNNYLTLTKDTQSAVKNISSLKSLVKSMKHTGEGGTSSRLEFEVVKKTGILEKGIRSLTKDKVKPVTLVLNVELQVNKVEKESDSEEKKRDSIKTFDITAWLSSPDAAITAKTVELKDIGSLIKAQDPVVESIIIPVLSRMVKEDSLS